MEKYKISGVEIFSTGTWNGDSYTNEDLNSMVVNFNDTKEGVRPFLKLGHDENQTLLQKDGFPAAGWVERVYVKGDKLVADFFDIPKKIFELIQAKAYRKVSSEIFINLKIGSKIYNKVLGAVALLGSDMPGVMNLSDILANYYSLSGQIKTYTFNHEAKIEGSSMRDEQLLTYANQIAARDNIPFSKAFRQALNTKGLVTDENEIYSILVAQLESKWGRELRTSEKADLQKKAKKFSLQNKAQNEANEISDQLLARAQTEKRSFTSLVKEHLREKEVSKSASDIHSEMIANTEERLGRSLTADEAKQFKSDAEKIYESFEAERTALPLDKRAREIAKRDNISYSQALKAVFKEEAEIEKRTTF